MFAQNKPKPLKKAINDLDEEGIEAQRFANANDELKNNMGGIMVESRIEDRKRRGSLVAENEVKMADSKRHAVAEALILRFTQHLYDSGFTSLLHAWIDVFDPTLTDNVTYPQFAERCNSIGF